MSIKIKFKVDPSTWKEIRGLARESHRGVSEVLTDAIREYVRRHRMRLEVLDHLEDSISENEELGRRLAG